MKYTNVTVDVSVEGVWNSYQSKMMNRYSFIVTGDDEDDDNIVLFNSGDSALELYDRNDCIKEIQKAKKALGIIKLDKKPSFTRI